MCEMGPTVKEGLRMKLPSVWWTVV